MCRYTLLVAVHLLWKQFTFRCSVLALAALLSVLGKAMKGRVCRRKQAAMKAVHPNKPPRVALFDTSSTASTEHTAYAVQRHAYLVSKIVDLRRKQKAIAFRQDQQLGAVADRVEAVSYTHLTLPTTPYV